jgi:hypothetical protein
MNKSITLCSLFEDGYGLRRLLNRLGSFRVLAPPHVSHNPVEQSTESLVRNEGVE